MLHQIRDPFEHLGFRKLTHFRIRSLLHCGNLARALGALQNRKTP